MGLARINFEDSWWMDERRYSLSEALGSKRLADGLMVEVWLLSQKFWGHGRRKIPLHVFKDLENYQDVIDAGLALVQGSLVYVRGTRQYHEWYATRLELSSKGGKSKTNDVKQTPSKRQANAKPLYSSLSSLSSNLNTNTIHMENSKSGDLLILLWNESNQLPKVKTITTHLRKLARDAFQEQPSVDFWRGVYKKVVDSPFLTGGNKSGWRADLHWLLSKGNYGKVADGSMDQAGVLTEDDWKDVFKA